LRFFWSFSLHTYAKMQQWCGTVAQVGLTLRSNRFRNDNNDLSIAVATSIRNMLGALSMTNAAGSTPAMTPINRFGPLLPPLTFAGFATAIVAVFVITFFSQAALEARSVSIERSRHTMQLLADLQQLASSVKDAETGQRGFLLTGEEPYLAPYTTARAATPRQLDALRSELQDHSEQLQRLNELQATVTQKFGELQETIDLRRAGRNEAALAVVRSDRGKATMDRFRDITTQMTATEQRLLGERDAAFQEAANNSVVVNFAGAILLLTLIIVSSWVTSRDVRAKAMDAWLKEGHAGLSARMQGEQRLDVLGNNVLSFLAGYLNAQVGAIYMAEADGRFRRCAGFAIPPQHHTQADVLRPGDGLVGQAARDRRIMAVENVPANYLPVASSLGSTPPAHLLIAPVSINNVVSAVIELGFLQPGHPSDTELLQRVGEAVAMAVSSSKDRTRLEELLAETQRQSEELQTQQEELRVSNEELEQQSNILRENQARLATQQAELEQTNVQLEEHTQMLARQNDDLDLARNELLANAALLERSNQFKSEFLANMSHELRTPLNSALILAKLLADNATGNLTDEQVKFARNIHSAGNDLLELINEILDLSKIEARQIDVTRDNVAIRDLADNMLQTFRPVSQQKGVEFEVNLADSVPPQLSTDSQRLRQILRNLISNALKFTIKGRVRLDVFVPDPQLTGAHWIAFAIEDTGIGIAPAQQEIIFEPFRQADGTTNRRFGGTGLGLSISRELATLLGGRIELRSQTGAGSTFTLLLPQVLPESTKAPERIAPMPPRRGQSSLRSGPIVRPSNVEAAHRAPTDKPQSGRNLLIVEDDVEFAAALVALARSLQFNCLVASTADEAIEMALAHLPTAIVLDVHLPDHTGLTVLDRLKHDPATRHIPVQVISGSDYTQTALEMGAANFLLKPVDRERLVNALSALERKSVLGDRAVLIVEDNAIQRDSIRQLLQSDDVQTVAVATASAALLELRQKTFDCMVLDLALPDATGYELLEKMAHDDLYSFPPVIVYTGRSLSTTEEQQLRRYSKSIIIKGAQSPERLLDEVTLFLHRVEASLPAEQRRMLQVARSREAVFENRKILLAEDDVRNVFAISRVLEPHGAKIEIARNGREALAALASHADIDLVLMDIMMPEMDGLEAMQAIRAQPTLANLPIIALTAKAMPDDRQRCLEAGANDYITKPIDVDKLLSLLRIWMPAQTAKRNNQQPRA
jgi:signal transduction histidine kinase/CheY-like chemotaxis protein/CHASE3 domain sensor protein